jgi:hypothetical protein
MTGAEIVVLWNHLPAIKEVGLVKTEIFREFYFKCTGEEIQKWTVSDSCIYVIWSVMTTWALQKCSTLRSRK